jgi:outer membrane protein assembly factor BamB
MLHEWSPVAGNWVIPGSYHDTPAVTGNEDAPETAHILWTKEYQMGGLAGDPLGAQSVECGAAYETKFTNVVAIGGTIYYNERDSRWQVDRVVAVDLRTGEERWRRELTDSDGETHRLSFGQAFYWDSYNYHGVFYYLWATSRSTWHAFDPTTGDWIYTMTDVPSGTTLVGDKGEFYRYTVNTADGWMTLWNSSRVVSNQGSWRPHGRTYNCTTRGYEWNVTIPTDLPGSAQQYYHGDRIIGMNGTSFERGIIDCVVNWAISLAPGQEGRLLWNEPFVPPERAVTMIPFKYGDPEVRVFVRYCRTLKVWYGFDMDSGRRIWTSEPQGFMDAYGNPGVYDGKLYDMGYDGLLHCYDIRTGKTLWIYRTPDYYNEWLFSNQWGTYQMTFIADDKVYISTNEHSPIDPKPRGGPFAAVDAQTGEAIFVIRSFYNSYMPGFLIGDSVVTLMNTYEHQIYAFGKGPSATTVTAGPKVSQNGNPVLVEGTVMDVSPGVEAANRKLRFPNGVPAVSDESMSHWMQYVYQQFPRPTNATGVEVAINVLDPNGNYYEVGRTTADADGFFKLSFEPPVPGEYTVIACFEGSKSYWPSHAKTALTVTEAPAATPAPTPAPASVADTYFLPVSIGLLIAIVVVGVVLFLMLRKR